MTTGNPDVREKLMERISKDVILIHLYAKVFGTVGESSSRDLELMVYDKVGIGCTAMSNIAVGHDVVVDDYCWIKYVAVISEREFVSEKIKVDVK